MRLLTFALIAVNVLVGNYSVKEKEEKYTRCKTYYGRKNAWESLLAGHLY